MALTNANVRDRLKTHYAAITGITRAFDFMPEVINKADLPCAIIQAGAATYDRDTLGEQFYLVNRTWTVTLLVAESTLPRGEAEKRIAAYFDSVADYFMARPGLETSGSSLVAYYAALTSDTGAQIELGEYAGVQFVHTITLKQPRSYI